MKETATRIGKFKDPQERIADALERIAEAMESLVVKPKGENKAN